MVYRMYIPPTKSQKYASGSLLGKVVASGRARDWQQPSDIMTPILGPDGQHTKAPHWAYMGAYCYRAPRDWRKDGDCRYSTC